jgi:hypothetical protein
LFSAPYGYVGFMSEFGSLLQGSDGAQYLRAAIQWAAAHHTGWAAWGWLPQAWDGYGLLTSYKPLTLNAKGRTVVNAL